uniref:Carbonic anhydrase n=1 Tax=Sordaria macrospora TaxID=5147 RepID=C1L337_SORMA|nr:beta class carbonic anhydrase [Sordaria macrospora]
MPVTNEDIVTRIEAASASYSSTFDKGHLALPPAKKYLLLTCMDARIDPARAFGIELGDAHVIRNAGASTKDALRSIIISQQLLATEAIAIVKHTGCGMLTFKNEDAYGVAEENFGVEARKELEERKLDFLPFPELTQAVRDDIEFLRGTKLVKDEVPISGWVYEVETGKTVRVV